MKPTFALASLLLAGITMAGTCAAQEIKPRPTRPPALHPAPFNEREAAAASMAELSQRGTEDYQAVRQLILRGDPTTISLAIAQMRDPDVQVAKDAVTALTSVAQPKLIEFLANEIAPPFVPKEGEESGEGRKENKKPAIDAVAPAFEVICWQMANSGAFPGDVKKWVRKLAAKGATEQSIATLHTFLQENLTVIRDGRYSDLVLP